MLDKYFGYILAFIIIAIIVVFMALFVNYYEKYQRCKDILDLHAKERTPASYLAELEAYRRKYGYLDPQEYREIITT
jgi:uncharacterized membrane protein